MVIFSVIIVGIVDMKRWTKATIAEWKRTEIRYIDVDAVNIKKQKGRKEGAGGSAIVGLCRYWPIVCNITQIQWSQKDTVYTLLLYIIVLIIIIIVSVEM